MMLSTVAAVLMCTAKINFSVFSWRSETNWFLVPTRVENMCCLSLRRVLTTWKTSTVFSFLALSKRFHKPHKTPERDEPSLKGYLYQFNRAVL